MSNSTVTYSASFFHMVGLKVDILRRSLARRSKSISPQMIWFLNRTDSLRVLPFSTIMLCAEKNQVCSGFTFPCVCINVSTDKGAQTGRRQDPCGKHPFLWFHCFADRFATTIAPAIAWEMLGGIGTHKSSQISTANINAQYPGI